MDVVAGTKEAASGAAPPTDMATSVPCSGNVFHFMKLPPEIRLLIYKKLLVCNGGAGCSFCPCWHHDHYNHSFGLFSYPDILRTCKRIYNEASSILYTDNIFELLCNCFHVAPQLWDRVESPLIPCPNTRASTYLRQAFLTYFNRDFPLRWPKIEQEVLEQYPKIEFIFLRAQRTDDEFICLKLVRRHQSKHVGERVSDHTARLDSLSRHNTNIGPSWNIFRDLCCVIWNSEIQGRLQETAFAVQAIRWGKNNHSLRSSWEDYDRYEIYMGCERNPRSDIEQGDGRARAIRVDEIVDEAKGA